MDTVVITDEHGNKSFFRPNGTDLKWYATVAADQVDDFVKHLITTQGSVIAAEPVKPMAENESTPKPEKKKTVAKRGRRRIYPIVPNEVWRNGLAEALGDREVTGSEMHKIVDRIGGRKFSNSQLSNLQIRFPELQKFTARNDNGVLVTMYYWVEKTNEDSA